jgi:hypothetical protein
MLEEFGIGEVSAYSFRHSAPFQLGGTVADALLAPTRSSSDVGWAAYRVDVCWSGIPKRNEELETRAELDHVSANLVRFSVVARCGSCACASGRIHYVRVQNGMNLATGSRIEEPLVLSPGHKQRNPGTLESQHYSPFLLKLLMNPIAGGREPLGRRLHPLGSVPLAAAVFQAASRNPESVVVSATMKYLSPMRTDLGFVTITDRQNGASVTVNMTNDLGVRFATCSVRLAAAVEVHRDHWK